MSAGLLGGQATSIQRQSSQSERVLAGDTGNPCFCVQSLTGGIVLENLPIVWIPLMATCSHGWLHSKMKHQEWESRGPGSQEAFNTYLLNEFLRIAVDFLTNVPCGESGTSAVPK